MLFKYASEEFLTLVTQIKNLVENAQRKTQEGKDIASDMIKGYSQLNENITTTLELIQNVTTASKEQASGMIQINDAVNSLDQITQLNAQNASSANEIAQKTLVISNTIIEQADAKEFNGKDSPDFRKSTTNTHNKL